MSAIGFEKNCVPSPTDHLVTGEELLAHPERGLCDLIRGRVTADLSPEYRAWAIDVASRAARASYVQTHALGMVFLGGSGVYLERDPDTVRGPDLHFVKAARWPNVNRLAGYLEIAPDLCVEIFSYNDLWSEVEDKVDQYLACGVKLVWVIDPKTRTAQVLRADGFKKVVAQSGKLSGENVLQGFEMLLSDSFAALDSL